MSDQNAIKVKIKQILPSFGKIYSENIFTQTAQTVTYIDGEGPYSLNEPLIEKKGTGVEKCGMELFTSTAHQADRTEAVQ